MTLAGCGPSGTGPKVVKAKIKLVYVDDKGEETPIGSDAMLQFHPEAADAKYVVAASIPTDGEFNLNTTLGQDAFEGAPPGKYKVTVMTGAGALEVTRAGTGPAVECTSVATTPLRVEISESGAVTPNPLKVPKAKPQQ